MQLDINENDLRFLSEIETNISEDKSAKDLSSEYLLNKDYYINFKSVISKIYKGYNIIDACENIMDIELFIMIKNSSNDFSNIFNDAIINQNEIKKYKHLNNIEEHSKDDWKASQWWLENIFSNEFSKNNLKNVEENVDGWITLNEDDEIDETISSNNDEINYNEIQIDINKIKNSEFLNDSC